MVVAVVRVLLQAWRPLLRISGASASIFTRRVGSSGVYDHAGARQRTSSWRTISSTSTSCWSTGALNHGRRLFDGRPALAAFRLADFQTTSRGVLALTYLAAGQPTRESFAGWAAVP